MKKFSQYILFYLLSIMTAHAQVTRVGHVQIIVSNLERSVAFYHDVLSFEKTGERELYGESAEHLENLFGCRMRIATMKLGDEHIELVDYLTSGGRPIAIDAASNDLSFQHIAIVVSDMDRAFKKLSEFHVDFVSTGPQTIPVTNKAASGVRAFYFHDPDRHNLELIYFPKGKGDTKWQMTSSSLFLGIDHTAIGISSTTRSLVFYQNLLGLEVKGESFNFGTEQEHLNNVEHASLHISGLRAANGPGIEFLEYLKPGPGVSFPSDVRADDLLIWKTVIYVSNLESLVKKLKENKIVAVSRDISDLDPVLDGIQKGYVVKDPDGHWILLAENQEMHVKN